MDEMRDKLFVDDWRSVKGTLMDLIQKYPPATPKTRQDSPGGSRVASIQATGTRRTRSQGLSGNNDQLFLEIRALFENKGYELWGASSGSVGSPNADRRCAC